MDDWDVDDYSEAEARDQISEYLAVVSIDLNDEIWTWVKGDLNLSEGECFDDDSISEAICRIEGYLEEQSLIFNEDQRKPNKTEEKGNVGKFQNKHKIERPSSHLFRDEIDSKSLQFFEAVGPVYARIAAQEIDVISFRHNVIAGHPLSLAELRIAMDLEPAQNGRFYTKKSNDCEIDRLMRPPVATPEQARRLMASNAARLVPWDKLVTMGVPTIDTEDVGTPEERTHALTVKYRKPGGEVLTEVLPDWIERRTSILLHDGIKESVRLNVYASKNQSQDEGSHCGSVLHKLHEIADSLAQRFSWSVPRSAWFILTGETPPVEPLKMIEPSVHGFTHHQVQRITLSIHPWMDPKDVEKIYRQLRSKTVGNMLPPKEKAFLLFQWIYDQVKSDWTLPSWDTLWMDWNKLHKNTTMTYSRSDDMRRAFKNTQKKMLLDYRVTFRHSR